MLEKEKILSSLKNQLNGKDVMEGIVYIPEVGEFLRISEGTGDNLLYEDEEEGYVDYIYIECYKMLGYDYDFKMESQDYIPTCGDGGLLMLEELYQDKYNGNFAQAIVDSLDLVYGYMEIDITQAFYIPEPSVNQMEDYKRNCELFRKEM